MMNNSTLNFIEQIKDEKPLWFEYFFVAAMALLLIGSNLLTWSLIKLINSRDQRLIDKLIKFHTIFINVLGKLYLHNNVFKTVVQISISQNPQLFGSFFCFMCPMKCSAHFPWGITLENLAVQPMT